MHADDASKLAVIIGDEIKEEGMPFLKYPSEQKANIQQKKLITAKVFFRKMLEIGDADISNILKRESFWSQGGHMYAHVCAYTYVTDIITCECRCAKLSLWAGRTYKRPRRFQERNL